MNRKTFETKMEDGWMIASTPAVDRDRDRVLPKGANITSFEKNPVLLFGHNYADPWAVIGRAADVTVGHGDIRFRPELRQPANDNDPMTIVQALWDQGLLKAASIGFNPSQYEKNEFGGRDFTEWELLEISLVPVPANQEALRLAAKAINDDSGIDIDEIAKRTADLIQRSTAQAVNDTADETEEVTESPDSAQVAGDATPENDDELTPDEEAALTELLENITAELLADLED